MIIHFKANTGDIIDRVLGGQQRNLFSVIHRQLRTRESPNTVNQLHVSASVCDPCDLPDYRPEREAQVCCTLIVSSCVCISTLLL